VDLLSELLVDDRSSRGWLALPGLEARARHTQHAAQLGDSMVCLLPLDQPEPHRRGSVSRAKKARCLLRGFPALATAPAPAGALPQLLAFAAGQPVVAPAVIELALANSVAQGLLGHPQSPRRPHGSACRHSGPAGRLQPGTPTDRRTSAWHMDSSPGTGRPQRRGAHHSGSTPAGTRRRRRLGPVAMAAAVADQLPRHRPGGPPQPTSDPPAGLAIGHAPADLLAFGHAQTPGPATW
jgi:hypothetical protein